MAVDEASWSKVGALMRALLDVRVDLMFSVDVTGKNCRSPPVYAEGVAKFEYAFLA